MWRFLIWAIGFCPPAVLCAAKCQSTDKPSAGRFTCDANDEKVNVFVARCSFRDLSNDGPGGAIYIDTGANTQINASLFLRCSAADAGGAAYAETDWIHLLYSCVVNCSARDGSVLWCFFDDEDGDADKDSRLSFNSFVGAHSSRDGTVYGTRDDENGNYMFDNVNFTACEASNDGVAFELVKSDLSFNASYLILVSLQGETGIHTLCGALHALSFCNIFGNRMSTSVFWCQTHGLSVSNCIFRENEGNRLIGMGNIPSSSNRFDKLHFL
jgi:hypothetical protein